MVKYDGSTTTSYTASGYSDYYNVIAVDKNNEIWIGGNKLIHFDGDTTWNTCPYMNGADTLANASKVTFNSANNVYVATDKGLLIFNGSTWSKFDTTNTPWPAEYVRALTLDANDGIWVGLSDGIIGPNYFGLWHYNGVTWENFTMYNSPLLFDKVDDIDVDELGNVWIGVALGYCVYNPNGLQGLVGINEPPSQTLHISISPNPTTGAATLHGKNALRTGDKI